MYLYIYMYIHAYIHPYVHIYTHTTCMYICTHIGIQIWIWKCTSWLDLEHLSKFPLFLLKISMSWSLTFRLRFQADVELDVWGMSWDRKRLTGHNLRAKIWEQDCMTVSLSFFLHFMFRIHIVLITFIIKKKKINLSLKLKPNNNPRSCHNYLNNERLGVQIAHVFGQGKEGLLHVAHQWLASSEPLLSNYCGLYRTAKNYEEEKD